MAPMKRPAAAAAAAGAAKKGRKDNVEATQKKAVQEQCKAVSSAVLLNSSFPKDVVKMLGQNVSSCLSTPHEERHAYQVTVIEMVEAVLSSTEKSLQEALAAAETKVAEAEAAKAERQAAVEAAAEATAGKTAAVEAAQAAHNEALQTVKAAKATLSATNTAFAADIAEFSSKETKKKHLEEIVASLAAADTESLSAEASAALVKAGKELGFDTSLLGSIPSAVQKTPETRGSFDALVIQQAREQITKSIQALEAALAAAEPSRAEQTAKIDAEKTELAEKQTLEVIAKDALTTAEQALKQAEDNQKAANKSLKALGPETKQAKLTLDESQSNLKSFTDGPFAAFRQLLVLSNVPVPEPVPEAPEPPVAPVEELAADAAAEAPVA